MTEKQKQLEQAREAAWRRGDDESEAWYTMQLQQLTQSEKEG